MSWTIIKNALHHDGQFVGHLQRFPSREPETNAPIAEDDRLDLLEALNRESYAPREVEYLELMLEYLRMPKALDANGWGAVDSQRRRCVAHWNAMCVAAGVPERGGVSEPRPPEKGQDGPARAQVTPVTARDKPRVYDTQIPMDKLRELGIKWDRISHSMVCSYFLLGDCDVAYHTPELGRLVVHDVPRPWANPPENETEIDETGVSVKLTTARLKAATAELLVFLTKRGGPMSAAPWIQDGHCWGRPCSNGTKKFMFRIWFKELSADVTRWDFVTEQFS